MLVLRAYAEVTLDRVYCIPSPVQILLKWPYYIIDPSFRATRSELALLIKSVCSNRAYTHPGKPCDSINKLAKNLVTHLAALELVPLLAVSVSHKM